MKDLSIVVPFYNEEENAEAVIKDLQHVLEKNKIDYEIIAVNNGSFDKTPMILDSLKSRRIRVVVVEKNIGFGYGIIKGLEKSRGIYVGYMWGDNQIPSSALVNVFRKLVDEDLDICKIKRTARNYSFFRKLESVAYNRLFLRMFFGKISYDINGSPKIMKRSIYERLHLKSYDWFIDTELMVKVRYLGARLGEVGVVYSKRNKGKSKVKFYVMIEFIKNLLKLRRQGLKEFMG
ncbi:MAG: glycosyltransferase family 2 protein [Candidatus Aenigmarchaeota archaeon]|nr:glycosyltransferase family 2 protein [Candidatus Aenigmarchaeota archaeon]MDI6722348.1 glycosyltransferase family 2 protein [Candidatus Aenigmarchaeota archaeon]